MAGASAVRTDRDAGHRGQRGGLRGVAGPALWRRNPGLGRPSLSRPAGSNPRARPRAKDFTNRRYRHRGVVNDTERAKNKTKSSVRAKVEHAIGVLKRIFGFVKVRYRGLEKNTNRLFVTCALANLFMARHHLLRAPGARCVQ